MTQSSNILQDFKLSSILGKNVSETLTVGLICILLVWYIQYHWKRRKLYRMAAQRKGPIAYPFIGSAYYFLGSNTDIMNKLLSLTAQYESPLSIWLGQRLFFGIWKPNQLEIIFNSPHALHKDQMYKFTAVAIGDGLLTAAVPKWKRHRKLIMPTFNQKNLDGFVEVFSEQSEVLVKQLKKEVGRGMFDIFYYNSRCTLDILCETAMGVTVNAQTTQSQYINWANKAMEIVFARMCGILYQSDFIFNRSPMAKELLYVTKKMHDYTGAVVVEKRKAYQKQLKEENERPEAFVEDESTKKNTFLEYLMKQSEKGEKLTDEELRDEVATFMFAGSDTSATTNSFLLVMLGMFPDIQDKVYQEVLDVVGPDRLVECKDLGKLQYLERVIKETLRLFPVAAFVVRAIVQDIQLDNCIIPDNSGVVLGIMSVQRDPNIWPDALKFDPDRFLPEEVAKRHPYSWIPFSGGPRNCVGPRYAMMSIKVLIATVIRKYRFSTDYKSVEDIKLKSDLVVKTVDGYRVAIELRE